MGDDVHNPNDIRQLYDSYQSKVGQKNAFYSSHQKINVRVDGNSCTIKAISRFRRKSFTALVVVASI